MAFNAEALMAAVTTAATSTEFLLLEPNETYTGLIKDVTLRTGTKEGRDWAAVDVLLEASGPLVQAATGRDKTTVKYGIPLDITEDGMLSHEAGSNVKLGKLREAIGQNKAGQAWQFNDLVGNVVGFQVKHRKVGDETYQDVSKVLPAA